jgi:STE24 endopeptidase
MLSSTLIQIPFSLYSTFVIEERHGFNKQTLFLFITDLIKEILLGIVIGAPVIAGLLKTIQWGGENFFYYVWLFMFVALLFKFLIS